MADADSLHTSLGTDSTGSSDDDFRYILDKIADASFNEEPFRHLVIDQVLSSAHFARLTSSRQIALTPAASSEILIADLARAGYVVQHFPGCTTDVRDYLRRLKRDDWPVDKAKLEAYGMAWRLARFDDPWIGRLVNFFNSGAFKSALERKFEIARPNRIETAIQKYLSGYEISPHPDIRSKCLTYLLNINPAAGADAMPLHTHLLAFKPRWRYIYEYWETHPESDRCWVPWDWCTSVKTMHINNSMVLFKAHDRSLHAIKLRYDHTRFQRTQIYGNLWYTDVPFDLPTVDYKQFDIRAPQSLTDRFPLFKAGRARLREMRNRMRRKFG